MTRIIPKTYTGIFLLTLTLLISPGVCLSQPQTVLEDSLDAYNIGPHLEYYEDLTRNLKFENITIPAISKSFQMNKSDIPNFGYSASNYWFRFNIRNHSKDIQKNWILEVGTSNIDSISIYYLYPDGKIKMVESGLLFPYSHREIKYQYFGYNLPIFPKEEAIVYMCFKSLDSKKLPINIYSEKKFFYQLVENNFFKSIYIGIILVMILYNFFIYLSIREKSYLYYIIFSLEHLS